MKGNRKRFSRVSSGSLAGRRVGQRVRDRVRIALCYAGFRTVFADAPESEPAAFCCIGDYDDGVSIVATCGVGDGEQAVAKLFEVWCEQESRTGLEGAALEDARLDFFFSPLMSELMLLELLDVEPVLVDAGFTIDKDYSDGLPMWHISESRTDSVEAAATLSRSSHIPCDAEAIAAALTEGGCPTIVDDDGAGDFWFIAEGFPEDGLVRLDLFDETDALYDLWEPIAIAWAARRGKSVAELTPDEWKEFDCSPGFMNLINWMFDTARRALDGKGLEIDDLVDEERNLPYWVLSAQGDPTYTD